MKSSLRISLNTSAEQQARLTELQTAFAEVCNALAPIVQQTRCWNRVALHHLAYRDLRERFPQMGSQMVCNAIYSVSRTCRLVLQHPQSPWNISKQTDKPLPLLRFLPSSPVYFDRHTLSFKGNQLSMYTLDGRMRFQLDIQAEDLQRFSHEKLFEIVLSRNPSGFELTFHFEPQTEHEDQPRGDLPEYILIQTPSETSSTAKYITV